MTQPAPTPAPTRTGGCFCGAVRYAISGPLTSVTYCHCSKCRRFHGHVGAYTAADRVAFRLLSEHTLRWHQVTDAVRRGFCGECGSTLFFDELADPRIALCPGSLDEPTGVREKAHIYVGSKGDYYAITGDLPRYDTMP